MVLVETLKGFRMLGEAEPFNIDGGNRMILKNGRVLLVMWLRS